MQEAEAAEGECRGDLEELDVQLAGLDAQLAAQQQVTQDPNPVPDPAPAPEARKAGRKAGRRGLPVAAAAEDEEGLPDPNPDREAAELPPQHLSRLTKRTRR